MSFLFFFQGISANMEICEQLEKISNFISHYQEHKSFNGDSFFDFVYEDYIADTHDSDGHHQDSEHEDVPIHNSHQCCSHFVFFTPFQMSLLNTFISEEQSLFNKYTSNIDSRYLESLFQPPKV
jgi:hypothetical protein